MTLCEEKCELIDYNYNIEKVKCSCEIKTKISANNKFNKKEFYKSFTDIKNIANIDILKCYKVAFNINNLKSNYGFYIMISIMILFFLTIFIFRFISYKKLKMNLLNMSKQLNGIESIEVKHMVNEKKNPIKKKMEKKKEKKMQEILIVLIFIV